VVEPALFPIVGPIVVVCSVPILRLLSEIGRPLLAFITHSLGLTVVVFTATVVLNTDFVDATLLMIVLGICAVLGGMISALLALLHLAAEEQSWVVVIGEALLASGCLCFILHVVLNTTPVGSILDTVLLALWSLGSASFVHQGRRSKGRSPPPP